MLTLAHRVRALRGWRAHALAVGLGLLSALALPPVHGLPALIVALPLLVWRLDATRSPWRAAGLGWLFGLGHFAGMTHWVSAALLVDAARTGWMVPFAVLGMAAGLAVFPALALGLARLAWRPGVGRVLVLAGAWTAAEALRGWILTGFPWAPIGMVWMPLDAMIQVSAFVGVTGLSLLTMVLLALPALAGDPGPRPYRYGAVAAAVLLFAALMGAGQARLEAYADEDGTWAEDGTWRLVGGDGTDEGMFRARLVQPAIPQALKWDAARMVDNVRHYVNLSARPGLEAVDAVIWGETAVPFALNLDDGARRAVQPAIPGGGVLIAGSVRRTPAEAPLQIWNSLFALDDQGRIMGVYDKAHLVPFGEYMPAGDILPLKKLTVGSTDFTPGPGPRTLDVGRLPPFSPLICYEVIFPGRVVAPGTPRPEWMLNLTNDGWYGHSAGPYQHFQIARLRALEEGLSLVRVANTGISGVVSPLGRVSPVLGLDVEGILDLSVPPPLSQVPLYGRLGEGFPVGLALFCAALGIVLGREKRAKSPVSLD
ncbi:apolipoprotein N-acyltransferase [Pararhodospirillum photometricum]|uniref:Apolipoprotein N-acyltransferase n=1 Tax=Pararhodospirillum photometricum DSM 122 TaxID=1150469 RepID=H6SMC8_PARPM|nr:apolipoprotein N-acyltransferase [Pararhodospirillum photometricum]CCG06811.1 Apolipoprotein N-acyltransferase [Pararhodospirillum photometricum DSM 122]